MDELHHWDFAWPEPDPKADEGFTRAAALREAKWEPGEIITVGFLDDDHGLKDKVKETAEIWTGPFLANLTFHWVEDPREATVRVSFREPGSWSALGNTCRYMIEWQKPTINFGWLDRHSTPDEIRRVVLHEFGHVLGMVHEHSSPAAGIKWNRKNVIADLYPRWSLEEIEHNVFRAYAEHETNYTQFDPGSIMVYPIPAHWTKDGSSVGLNADLSDMDRWFIRNVLYP
jgi:serralysin